jgi:hypothetical protein
VTSPFTGSLGETKVCCSAFSFEAGGLCHLHLHDFPCLGLAVADVLLWKDRNVSAGVLAGATLIWYLFEVVEYNIIPLLCQIAAVAMLVAFIWSNAAPLLSMYGGFLVFSWRQKFRKWHKARDAILN